ncbi:hypothetical protein BCR34DRAFT_621456 [Clohesyomyces aquaticus]|uniref:Dol-P-Man:Man(5)GlcNAc(2)-PP-Dol alpha-1,3-mannosyltransferase n=1 Tax=Clohesyomyces aquaticus TaxID=1231657 RepID=A0A1Y2A700_9PLEO|nr:hypothetical protein BCR34DRAFT_621456 [Clohesyomyces aquaticus]
MSKLSPKLKALISAVHARPGPTPSFHVDNMYRKIAREAISRTLPTPAWLALTTAATMTMNSPDAMIVLYQAATADKSQKETVEIVEFMREVGLKCIGFNGVPRTINMLNAFRAALPSPIISSLSTTPTRLPTPSNIESINERGRQLWNSIYRPLENKLEAKLADAHPDLPVFIISGEYGALFTDPPRRTGANVGRITTSLVAIACLRAQQGVGPQVLSHVYGLRKAFEDGTWKTEAEPGTEEAMKWLASDEGCTWALEKVDEVVESLGGGQGSTFAPVKAKL